MRTSSKNRLKSAALLVLLLPLMSALSATPAAAAWWKSWGDVDGSDGDAGGSTTYTELRWSSNPLDAQAGYIAEFQAYDERLILDDNDTDGHKVRGVLTVEGQGTAAFVGTGVRDLNYAEGKSYWLQVCINGTSTCSEVFRGTT